jgi:hypothetical protein
MSLVSQAFDEGHRKGEEARLNRILEYLEEEISKYEEHGQMGATPNRWRAERKGGKHALECFQSLLIGLFKTEAVITD